MAGAATAAVHVAIRAHDFASATLARLRAQLRALAAQRVHIGLGDQTFGEQFRQIGFVSSAINALKYPITAIGNAAGVALPIIARYGAILGLIGVAARAAIPPLLQAASAIGSALGITALGAAGIGAAAYLEHIEARFQAVAGATGLAGQRLEDYRRLARETGASIGQMLEAATASLGANVDLRPAAMAALVNAARIVDGNTGKLGNYGEALANFVRNGEKFELGNFLKYDKVDGKQTVTYTNQATGQRVTEQVASTAEARAEQIMRIMQAAIPQKAVTLWDQIKIIAANIVQMFAKIGESGLLAKLKEQLENVRDTLRRAFETGQIDRIGQKIADAFQTLFGLQNSNFGGWLQGILNTIEQMDWQKLAQEARDFFLIDLPGFWENLKKIADQVFQVIGYFANLLEKGAELIGWGPMLAIIAAGFLGLLGPIVTATIAVSGFVAGLFRKSGVLGAVRRGLLALAGAAGIGGAAVTGFGASFAAAGRVIRTAIRRIPIIGWLIAAIELVIYLGEMVWENWGSIKAAITGAWNSIVAVAGDSWNWLKRQVEAVWKWLDEQTKPMRELGEKIFNEFWEGLKKVWNDLSKWVGDKVLWLFQQMSYPLSTLGLVSEDTGRKIENMRNQIYGQVQVNANIAGLPQGSTASMSHSGAVAPSLTTSHSPYPISGSGNGRPSGSFRPNPNLSAIADHFR